MCKELHKPFFEVCRWPDTEMEIWSLFFSIDDNKDKPVSNFVPLTAEEMKQKLRGTLS